MQQWPRPPIEQRAKNKGKASQRDTLARHDARCLPPCLRTRQTVSSATFRAFRDGDNERARSALQVPRCVMQMSMQSAMRAAGPAGRSGVNSLWSRR